VDDDLLRLDLDLSLEAGIDDTRVALLRPSQIPMEGVDQPTEELDGIALLCHLELSSAPLCHFLQELVRADLGFEEVWIP
jgi:hypothetical protein